jgi:hypothetical protein
MGELYTLATKWRSIEDQLEESGGEITEEIAQEMLDVEANTDEAVKSLICLKKEREATNNFITQEVALLTKRKRQNESVIETYEKTLTEIVNTYGSMGSNGHRKYEVGPYKVMFRESKSTVVKESLVKYITDYVWGVVASRFKRWKNGEDYVVNMDTAGAAESITKAIMNFTPELLQEGFKEIVDEDGDTRKIPYYSRVTQDDVETNTVKLTFTVPIHKLLTAEENEDGFNLIAAANSFPMTIDSIISKTELKEQLNNRILSTAKIQTNANLQIK